MKTVGGDYRVRVRWGVVCLGMALSGCSKQERAEAEPDVSSASAERAGSASAEPAERAPAAQAASEPAAEATKTGSDTVETSKGPLTIIPVHHGTLAFQFAGKTIWIDPWSKADLNRAPKADYVFITDNHQDHLDPAAVERVSKEGTVVVGPKVVKAELPKVQLMQNGDERQFPEFGVAATPMYNLKRGPEPGKLYHDKGRGNGYLFTFGDKRVYVSGDTECTEEMRALEDIDVAFVTMNLPYTMPPEEAAACVKAFKPDVVYPFHYRGSDLGAFEQTVSAAGVDVRLRDWY